MKLHNSLSQFWLGAFLIFLLDQGTKIWALNYLALEDEYLINNLLSFQRIYNEATVLLNYQLPFGISTDFFRIIWVAIAAILTLSIYWVIKQPALRGDNLETQFAKCGLFIIMGSIWGNAYDRIFRSEGVVDFIRINFLTDSIPIMNIADIMIYWGDVCFIITWGILLGKLLIKKLVFSH